MSKKTTSKKPASKKAEEPRISIPVIRLHEMRRPPNQPDTISRYEQAYENERLTIPPKVREFLRDLGGATFKYELRHHQEDVLDFVADRAVQGMGAGIKCFEELIGVSPLCPIGHYLFGTCMLLMDRRGRVFGGSDTTVTLVGNSASQAIWNILSGAEADILEPKDRPLAR